MANPDGSTRRPWFLHQPMGGGSFETGRFPAQEWSDSVGLGAADDSAPSRGSGRLGRGLAAAAFVLGYFLVAVPIVFFLAVFVTFSVADTVHSQHRPASAVTESSSHAL